MRREAVRSALSQKYKDGEINILNEFKIEEPKTRLVVQLLGSLDLEGKRNDWNGITR